VRAAWPGVDIVGLPDNLHFAAGANVGLRRVLARGADYAWLLNNDVTVMPDALAEMVCVAEADKSLGVVGARLVHTGRSPRVVVGAHCDLGSGAIHEPEPPPDPNVHRLPVDYIWGCAMLLRTKMLRQVGLLDERYVAYFEDADLCFRARQSGWHTVTALRATVRHVGSKTANQRFAKQMWLRGRNWVWCFWRHASRTERPRLLLSMLRHHLPLLAWSSLMTVAASALRPRQHHIRLWS
jgi:GT2 family glycosyltransferase